MNLTPLVHRAIKFSLKNLHVCLMKVHLVNQASLKLVHHCTYSLGVSSVLMRCLYSYSAFILKNLKAPHKLHVTLLKCSHVLGDRKVNSPGTVLSTQGGGRGGEFLAKDIRSNPGHIMYSVHMFAIYLATYLGCVHVHV